MGSYSHSRAPSLGSEGGDRLLQLDHQEKKESASRQHMPSHEQGLHQLLHALKCPKPSKFRSDVTIFCYYEIIYSSVLCSGHI